MLFYVVVVFFSLEINIYFTVITSATTRTLIYTIISYRKKYIALVTSTKPPGQWYNIGHIIA